MKNLFLKILLNISCRQTVFKRKYWLLADNVFNKDAELVDNFSLFEYMQTQDTLKNDTFYIINKKNSKYHEIKRKYKNIIPVDNCKVNLNLITKLFHAKYWLDSFQIMHRFNLHLNDKLANSPITTIYTQHGINYFKRWFWDTDEIGDKFFKKIVFSNKQERDLFKQFFGFDDKNTIIAGLSRWDNMLTPANEKSIFMYFTFRNYLFHPQLDITSTNYYKNIVKLLHSEKLNHILEKHNVKIHLGLHHLLQHNIDFNNSNIKIIKDCDIGQVKQNASMLISDYSSMCFDFMFNDRPVAFYRIDKSDPLLAIDIEGRINESNIENKNNDLYNIYYDEDSIIDCIERYCLNDFELESEFKKLNNKFFEYRKNIKDHIINGILNSEDNIPNDKDRMPLKHIENGKYPFAKAIPMATDGLYFIEHFGRYSLGNNSRFWLKIKNKSSGCIIFNVQPVLFRNVKKRNIEIYVNNQSLTKITLNRDEIYQIKVPFDLSNNHNDILKITFKYGKVKSPKRLRVSKDTRKIAIRFLSIEVFKD